MKKSILPVLISILFVACSGEKGIRIQVSNNTDYDRTEEVIEFRLADLQSMTMFTDKNLIITDNKGRQIPRQFIYNGKTIAETLLFPVTLKAGKSAVFTIKEGEPEEFPVKTFGRLVPERKEDFAWENDKVVYRIYGPPLAIENSSNGVDMWLKKTDKMIVDQFYNDDLNNGRSYHVDHGEGLDCYKVGYTLGAGAVAPFSDNKIWVQGPYSSAKVIDAGVLRTTFEATIDSVKVDGKIYQQRMIVSLDAGSHFNKATVYYSGDFNPIEIAAGIYLHDAPGDMTFSEEAGYVNYAENVRSDAGIDAGRSYISVYSPMPMKQLFQDNQHIAAIFPYPNNTPFTYYFGSGWSQWSIETDSDWNDYVNGFIQRTQHPLTIKLLY